MYQDIRLTQEGRHSVLHVCPAAAISIVGIPKILGKAYSWSKEGT